VASYASKDQNNKTTSLPADLSRKPNRDPEALACDIRQKKEYLRKICTAAQARNQGHGSSRDQQSG